MTEVHIKGFKTKPDAIFVEFKKGQPYFWVGLEWGEGVSMEARGYVNVDIDHPLLENPSGYQPLLNEMRELVYGKGYDPHNAAWDIGERHELTYEQIEKLEQMWGAPEENPKVTDEQREFLEKMRGIAIVPPGTAMNPPGDYWYDNPDDKYCEFCHYEGWSLEPFEYGYICPTCREKYEKGELIIEENPLKKRLIGESGEEEMMSIPGPEGFGIVSNPFPPSGEEFFCVKHKKWKWHKPKDPKYKEHRKEMKEIDKEMSKNPRRPPKIWWDKMVKTVKEGAKGKYSPKQIAATVGQIWYHGLKPKTKRKILKEEGVKSNPPPEDMKKYYCMDCVKWHKKGDKEFEKHYEMAKEAYGDFAAEAF